MPTLKKKIYLGVEGGATNSTAILADEDKLLAQREGKALNYRSEGQNQVRKNLTQLINPLLKKTEGRKLFAVFGFAGLDTPQNKKIYQGIVRSVLPAGTSFLTVNDADIALEAKCPGEKNRIVVISGTGSTVYGESEGKQAKSIGLGDYILSDEGSGYSVGVKVLKTAIQSWDGRIQKTILEDLVLKYTKSKTIEDFVNKFYQIINKHRQSAKLYIASFAALIDRGILQNDWVALQIRKETIDELAVGVFAVVNRLNLKGKKFSIGVTGSLWKTPGFEDLFHKTIMQRFPDASFSHREDNDAWGAVLLAKKLE